MIQVDMSAPATLCRVSVIPSKTDPERGRGVAVARGPFLIMAHGYLAQPLVDRPAFWIRSGHRDVMPAEIEETMRRWSEGSTGMHDMAG